MGDQEVPSTMSSQSPKMSFGASPRREMLTSSSSMAISGPRVHSPTVASTTPPLPLTPSVSLVRKNLTTRRTSEESSPSPSSTSAETESKRERQLASPSQATPSTKCAEKSIALPRPSPVSAGLTKRRRIAFSEDLLQPPMESEPLFQVHPRRLSEQLESDGVS